MCFYRDLRAKRKRKKLLQEQHQPKEMDEKSEEKVQDKIKSETDEDTKDTITAMDEESQGDSTESKVCTTKLCLQKLLKLTAYKCVSVCSILGRQENLDSRGRNILNIAKQKQRLLNCSKILFHTLKTISRLG